jgi:hypothetical protein
MIGNCVFGEIDRSFMKFKASAQKEVELSGKRV